MPKLTHHPVSVVSQCSLNAWLMAGQRRSAPTYGKQERIRDVFVTMHCTNGRVYFICFYFYHRTLRTLLLSIWAAVRCTTLALCWRAKRSSCRRRQSWSSPANVWDPTCRAGSQATSKLWASSLVRSLLLLHRPSSLYYCKPKHHHNTTAPECLTRHCTWLSSELSTVRQRLGGRGYSKTGPVWPARMRRLRQTELR